MADLDHGVGDGESVVAHDLHCTLLVFLARASKEVRTPPADYDVEGVPLDEFVTLSEALSTEIRAATVAFHLALLPE